MMVIAFIILTGPLIEGLCSSDSSSQFQVFILCFSFLKEILCLEKAVSPRSHPVSQHMYTHMYLVQVYENTYMPRFGPFGLFGPPLTRVDHWTQIRVPHVQRAHSPTYNLTRVKK